jgi:hypothetical protein
VTTTGREIHWASLTLTEGDVLAAFASYCRDVGDLDVTESGPGGFEIVWRGRERSIVEVAAQPPDRAEPTLALSAITDTVVQQLLDDARLRGRLAVYDLARLEKVNAVRSSVFVYFEWFLRDDYGVRVVPADAFTRGLVERGIISLGFG